RTPSVVSSVSGGCPVDLAVKPAPGNVVYRVTDPVVEGSSSDSPRAPSNSCVLALLGVLGLLNHRDDLSAHPVAEVTWSSYEATGMDIPGPQRKVWPLLGLVLAVDVLKGVHAPSLLSGRRRPRSRMAVDDWAIPEERGLWRTVSQSADQPNQ